MQCCFQIGIPFALFATCRCEFFGQVSDMASGPHDLISALLNPSVWPDRPERVELIETHVSWVFLTREFAWKIKKPVQFDFLDFSTLEQRKRRCDDELKLNCRTAPELYLGVVPISGTTTGPIIDGDGEPFEFAVKMKRFDNAGLLSRMAIEKRLTSELVDQLAETIAEFHGMIPQADSSSAYGRSADICRDALDNFSTIEQLANGDEFHEAAVQYLKKWTTAEGRRLDAVLTQRRSAGFVRECHGDLHLRNIVRIDGRPCLFDCIEFNAGFRWIDVISEVAFLVMDLEEHNEEPLARRLLNRYLERTGDYEGLRVLRFYLVYRAMVRAKVDMIRLRDRGQSAAQRRVLLNEFGTYLTIADHNAERKPPTLLIMHGLSGSGKTTMSQRIIEHGPVIRIRSDIERKRLHGIGETDRVFGTMAERLYSPHATRRTYAHLSSLATTVIKAGFSVVVDATFLKAEERDHFRKLGRRLDVPFRIIACLASEGELLDRVASRDAANLDASDAGVSVLRNQLEVETGINEEPPDELITVDTANEKSMAEAISRLGDATACG